MYVDVVLFLPLLTCHSQLMILRPRTQQLTVINVRLQILVAAISSKYKLMQNAHGDDDVRRIACFICVQLTVL